MLCLALPKDEQSEGLRVGARPCTSAARRGNFRLIQVNSFCCSFSHRWPGVGRTRRECSVGALVILCDNHSLPSWLSDLLSTHTLGANVASRVLLCRMTAKRYELTRSLGVHAVMLCVHSRGGQKQQNNSNESGLHCCLLIVLTCLDLFAFS